MDVYKKRTCSGRFSGLRPKQAANKAFSALAQEYQRKNQEILPGYIHFTLQECTRGSKKQTYQYTGKRTKLQFPMTIQISPDNVFTYNYSNTIYKYKG